MTTCTSRRHQWWFRGLVALGVLTGLGTMVLVGGAFWLGRVASNTLDTAIAEADRLDPGWRLDDIERNREAVPAEVNSASRVGEVLALLPDERTAALPRSQGAGSKEVPGRGILLLPTIPDERANVLLTKSMAEAVRAETARISEPITRARELVRYPKGRTDLVRSPNPLEMTLPHLSGCRTVADLLNLDAIARVQDGDGDGALESCRALLNVARSLGDEPLIVSQLVRIAITTHACSAVERTLARSEPGDRALAAMQETFLAETDVPFVLNALRGERALAFRLIHNLNAGKVPLSQFSGGQWRPSPIAFPGHPLYRYNQGLSLHFLNRAVEIAKKPSHEQPALWRAWESEISPKNKDPLVVHGGALAYLLLPATWPMASAAIRARAHTGLCAVLVAAERYRKAKDHWPESAAQIEEALGIKLPTDPYLPGPIHLKRTDDGLVVYMVGPDQVDNCGTLNNRQINMPNVDIGYRLWDVPKRRQSP